MKKLSLLALIGVLISSSLCQSASAQSDKPYTEGSVWLISYVKAKDGMEEPYLKDLDAHWVKLMQTAKNQGYIQDFTVLSSPASHPGDWDLMLMVKVKNYGAMDILGKQLDPMARKLFGSRDTLQKSALSRNDMRVKWGSRIAQQLNFK